jgi:putative ABC transport system permease protein
MNQVKMFSLRMAWRETRAAWRHFLYFLACIAVGVGGLVAVSLFGVNVEQAVTREARGLLGGDIEIRLSHQPGERATEVLLSLEKRGVTVNHASELAAMVSTGGTEQASDRARTLLVELKAVEAGYPLYGVLAHSPEAPLASLLEARRLEGCLPTCYGALVQESFLIQMGMQRGARIKIGEAVFVITGVIQKEPDRMANMFSIGPRVLISQEGLAAAELVKPGSRVRERFLLRLPSSIEITPIQHELRGRLAGESARVSSYREAQPQLKQFLDQLSQYLGLVGLTALFVGGIGVAASVQSFLREKLQSIAVLKILGADTATIILTYLGQALGLGLVGSLAGVLVGLGLQSVLPMAVSQLIEVNILDQVQFSSSISGASLLPIIKGIGLGLLTTLLFSLWPLLAIRAIKPAAIFRRDVEGIGGAAQRWALSLPACWKAVMVRDRPRLIAALCIAAGLAGLSIWQAGSVKVGAFFIAGLLVAVLLLILASQALLSFLRRLPASPSITVRQAVGNIIRPGSQTLIVMMSIGVGVMVMVTIGMIEHSLVNRVQDNRPTDAPTFFFIDIQPDQADSFRGLLHKEAGELSPALTPLVRSRLRAINGQVVTADIDPEAQDDAKREDRRKNWYLTREYVLTFLDQPPKDNLIVKGTWWEPGQQFTEPLLSIEEEAAKHLGLDIGSSVELEIQGVTLKARISSIRKVEWGNFSTNFYMIVSPGALDGAPFTYVATVRVPPAEEASLQRAVVAAFPNVTAVNIGDVLDSFARILDRLSLAVRAVALFCILAGALVMATTLSATRYRRLYESVILKALGATRGMIARSFAVEYVILGLVAGCIGVLLAGGLSWAVLRFILDLPWAAQPRVLFTGLGLTVLLTLLVGFLSTFRILGQRPLAVLRHE